MKQALVSSGPKVEIVDSPIPTPGDDAVLIKVVVSGSNPKDWKYPHFTNSTYNSGDDMAGTIAAVGANVWDFKVGDRVAAFHVMKAEHGSFAEYGVAPASSTFRIPSKTSYEEAATIPLAAMTAAAGLYSNLGLPAPWEPAQSPIPLIIYGASSAVGAFAGFVETLIDRSKGDAIVDYREGPETLVKGIKDAVAAAGLAEVKFAFDTICEHDSYIHISKGMAPTGHITVVLPGKKGYSDIPQGMTTSLTWVGLVHHGPYSIKGSMGINHQSTTNGKDFGFVYFRLFGQGLADGWFSGHPYEVLPGGLASVETGLDNLRNGRNSAKKYVFRIAETEGAGKTGFSL
ncbi:chaperonin 10-like protein [Lineolata rhizophorae]|uniref:Chaperonin 10-like protein n=1 Tax=Lineolata rhizophorae TaxID=578093 RepID=A0A6A6P4S2_9PEZI|nr:chaperonin 10-like protein [Lineolata rhizophorae]